MLKQDSLKDKKMDLHTFILNFFARHTPHVLPSVIISPFYWVALELRVYLYYYRNQENSKYSKKKN
ncbi:hypothetical protein C1N70_25290 (plasmid) [Cytobacillus firmus]